MQIAHIAGRRLNPMDESRNKQKPMLKFQYVNGALESVKITEITEKIPERINNDKYLDRPLKRDDFNFRFSTLNAHDWSVREETYFSLLISFFFFWLIKNFDFNNFEQIIQFLNINLNKTIFYFQI